MISRRHLIDWFFLFGCNLMWALQFTCIKLVQDQVGPLFTVWGPMTLATVMLLPFILHERKVNPAASRREKKDFLIYAILAVLGVFPGQVLITWGTRWSLASNAALLMLTLPVCTAFMAYIFLAEKMTPVRWVSFALALAGVVMCSDVDWGALEFGAGFLAGNVLIFIGLNGSAFYNSYGKKILRRYSPMEMLFFTYLGMFVVMTPLTLIMEPDVWARIPDFTAQTWIGLVLLTVFHNWLSMVLFLKALKRLYAIQVALSNYLITFFGLPIAAIWLRERLTLLAIVGGIIVLCSTLLITLWEDTRAIRAEKTRGQKF
jgi:drug/metabolite transporter (DMT)-like permease